MRTILLGLLIASAVLVPTVALADKGGQPHQGSNGIGNDPDKHDDQNERRCNDHNQDKNPHCNSGSGSGNGGGTNSTGNNSGSGSGSGSKSGTNSTQAGGDSSGSGGGENNQGNGTSTDGGNTGSGNGSGSGSNSTGSGGGVNDGGSGTSGNQNNGSGNNNNQGSNQQGGTSDQEKFGFSAGSGRVSNWPFQHMIEKRVLCQTYKDEKDCYAYQIAYYGYFGAKAEPQDMHTQWDSYYQRMVAWIS